jgi:hypothetical protein
MNHELSLPPRFRESAFRRYEHVISQIVHAYPQAVSFHPQRDFHQSPVTFSNRLRDAITSLHRFGWPSNDIDMAKFLANHHDYVVSERGVDVYVGSRTALKALFDPPKDPLVAKATIHPLSAQTTATIAVSTTLPNPEPFDCLQWSAYPQILDFLLTLVHNRVITRPILVHPISADDALDFESRFDLLITTDTDNKHSVIS